MAAGRDHGVHPVAAEREEQRVGGAVVAFRDHGGGEAVQRHRRSVGPAHQAAGKAFGAERDDVAPAPIPGGDGAGEFGEDIEFEAGAGRHLRIGAMGADRLRPGVGQPGDRQRARAGQGDEIGHDLLQAVVGGARADDAQADDARGRLGRDHQSEADRCALVTDFDLTGGGAFPPHGA